MKKSILLAIILLLMLAGLMIKESEHEAIRAAEDYSGYRISPPFSLALASNVDSSYIEWDAETPEGTSITIQTAITDSDTEMPEDWLSAENEQPIPGIEEGDDLTDKYLWTKQILQSSNSDPAITPKLYSLTEKIFINVENEGYRISPEFDISGLETVKDSRIFWQAEEKFDGSVRVEISYDGGNSWSEESIINGDIIPGLEPGTSLTGKKIKTKTSFIGGPYFYPSLENIKIFLELE